MPTSITIEADKKNQEPTQNAHFAQVSDELNLQIGLKTKKSVIGKLIYVQEIQVDPYGNGWEKPTLRQTVPHLHFFIFSVLKFLKILFHYVMDINLASFEKRDKF